MEKKLWFRNKRYGWGWTPATREGWFAILIYVLLLIPIMRNFILLADSGEPLDLNVVTAIGRVFLLTFALILLCYHKGEKPSWHWGEK
jgi:hypothetical protein